MRTAKTAKQIRPRGQRGVTLVELMIALVLTAVIGGALYRGLVNQTKSFVQQDQSDEAMQHCRTATDQILRELRMAGYIMAYQDSSGITVNDRGIVVGTTTVINGTTLTTNNDANRGTTDSLVIRRGDSVPWTVWKYKYKYKDKHGVEKTKVTFDERITVRFGDPDYVFLLSIDRKEYRTAVVQEKGLDDEYANKKMIRIDNYTGSITSTNGLTYDYSGGTCVKLKEIAFYIDTSSGIPTLMKAINGNPSQIVARYIEDFQVAYQDNAGVWYRGGSGTTQTNPPTVNNIRNVRINILARASTATARTPYFHAALEDGNRHPATGGDGFLRRSLTSQVRARNFGVD
jgi:prepilin-type N-terminal cleavage/methylation domain-containing protein